VAKGCADAAVCSVCAQSGAAVVSMEGGVVAVKGGTIANAMVLSAPHYVPLGTPDFLLLPPPALCCQLLLHIALKTLRAP
jgi:hypothetical protein